MTEQLRKIKLKVGLTIFGGIVILFVFIIMIGTDEYLFTQTYNLYAYLDNTAGLIKGAPVTLGGYKIGDVEAVDFVTLNKHSLIKIKLRIKKEYKSQIKTSSEVCITSIGILGDKFIDLSFGNTEDKELEENSFLKVKQSISLDNITSNIAPGVENFNRIMENLKTTTDSIAAGRGSVGQLINTPNTINEINQVVKKIDLLLTSLHRKDSSLNKFINDSELYDNLSSAGKSLKEISEEIQNGKGTIGKLVKNDSLYNNVNKASLELNNLLAKTHSDSTLVGGLFNDKNIYKNVNVLITDLNKLINDIREHPDRYVNVSVF